LVDRNRIIPSILIVLSLSIFYLLEIDKLLIFFLFIFCLYDLFYSKIIYIKSALFLTLIFFSSLFFSNYYGNFSLIYLSLFFIFFLAFFLFHNYQKKFFMYLILVFLLSCFELIKFDKNLFYLIIVLSFINDTSAYIFGRLLRGPLILKFISPNKTWSGTLFSFFITVTTMYFLNFHFLFSVIVSMLFFLGDFFFSYFKRLTNIKDFSNSLYGHGGILDRLDSIFFVVFIFLFKINFFI